MSDEFKMPSGFFTFELPDGRKVEIEPLSAQEEWEKIAEDCRGKPETNRQSIYLDRVSEWFANNCGVRLNRSQVDFVLDQTFLAVAKKKSERRALFVSMQPSPSSTE